MRMKFWLNGEKREGLLLAVGHGGDATRRVSVVGMVTLKDGSFQRLVYVRPSRVIERIPEEGDPGWVEHCRNIVGAEKDNAETQIPK